MKIFLEGLRKIAGRGKPDTSGNLFDAVIAVSYTHLDVYKRQGMYRDPETAEPIEYYCKLPADCANREVFVVDPMLATGGSAVAALDTVSYTHLNAGNLYG